MSFIERLFSLRRLKCTSIIEKRPQSVSFIERFILLCPLFRVSIVRGSTVFILSHTTEELLASTGSLIDGLLDTSDDLVREWSSFELVESLCHAVEQW